MNSKLFFDAIRPLFGRMSKEQVDGINAILKVWEGQDLRYTAYALGTAYIETNHTMQPVAEAYYLEGKVKNLDAWRKAHLRYYPHYGRGYVQLTWDYNYKKADEKLLLGGALIKNPDLAMDPDIAAQIMLHGMIEGWFTGKKLGDYFTRTSSDWVNARRIINRLDRAKEIAAVAQKFHTGLQAAAGLGHVEVSNEQVHAMVAPKSPVLAANPTANVIGSIVSSVLHRQDVPIKMDDVQSTTEKVMAGVATAVAAKDIAVVPVVSGIFSKINWTAGLAPFASLVSMGLGLWGLDLSPQAIIATGVAVQTVFSTATIIFRTFFTKSVTPGSVGV